MKAAMHAQAAFLHAAAAAAAAAPAGVVETETEDHSWLLAKIAELHVVGPLNWGYAELSSHHPFLKPVRRLVQEKMKNAAQTRCDVAKTVPVQRAAHSGAASG